MTEFALPQGDKARTRHSAANRSAPPLSVSKTLMHQDRVNEIDLVRFIAAMSVVLFHYAFRGYAADGYSPMPYPLLAPIAKYGYLGVELFFMVSGFVILMTAASGNLQRFIVSRMVRLYPAFWVSGTITFIAILTMGGEIFHATITQYLVNMTMLSEFVRVPSIDGVYWSLFVELKFYALVSLVLIVGRIHQAQRLLVVWLLLTISQAVYPIGAVRYFPITDFAAYFIAGAIAFLVWSRGLSRARVAIYLTAWLAAAYQSRHTAASFEKHYNESLSSFAVVGIVSAFFLIIFLVSVRRTGWFSRTRWVMAGALTYPLYLVHQKVGYMLIGAAFPVLNPHVALWGTVALVLLVAFAIHYFVERRASGPLRALLTLVLGWCGERIASAIGKLRSAQS